MVKRSSFDWFSDGENVCVGEEEEDDEVEVMAEILICISCRWMGLGSNSNIVCSFVSCSVRWHYGTLRSCSELTVR